MGATTMGTLDVHACASGLLIPYSRFFKDHVPVSLYLAKPFCHLYCIGLVQMHVHSSESIGIAKPFS